MYSNAHYTIGGIPFFSPARNRAGALAQRVGQWTWLSYPKAVSIMAVSVPDGSSDGAGTLVAPSVECA